MYTEPLMMWPSEPWPLPRRVLSCPPLPASLHSALRVLRGRYVAACTAVDGLQESKVQIAAAVAVLRPGFSKRACVRLAALAVELYGEKRARVLLDLLGKLVGVAEFSGKVAPYSERAYFFSYVRGFNSAGLGEEVGRLFNHPDFDSHDLFGLWARQVTSRDFSAPLEKESDDPERAEALLRWRSGMVAFFNYTEKCYRAEDGRVEAAGKVASLFLDLIPTASPEIACAGWLITVRDRMTPAKVYRESPHFSSPHFWFQFLVSQMRLKGVSLPESFAGDVLSLVNSPKGKPVDGVSPAWVSSVFSPVFWWVSSAFKEFRGQELALYRAWLGSFVIPREGEGQWLRPCWALACLCAKAVPEWGGMASQEISKLEPFAHYSFHGLALGVYSKLYIPEGLDFSAEGEIRAWEVQRSNEVWEGPMDSSPDIEEFEAQAQQVEAGQASFEFCPVPEHPFLNLVKVELGDPEEFFRVYAQFGIPPVVKPGSVRSALLWYLSLDPILVAAYPHEDFGGVKWMKIKRGGVRILVWAAGGGRYLWNVYLRRDYHRGSAGSGQN